MSLAIALHVLASIVWVGGMFFALLVLRPSVGAMQAKDRLELWARVFDGFFYWVWGAIVILLASGYWMLFMAYGGFAGAPPYVHLMNGTGIIMVLIFLHLYFAPYRRFRAAVAGGNPLDAAKQLAQIRALVATNLTLGLINAAIGAGGRYLVA